MGQLASRYSDPLSGSLDLSPALASAKLTLAANGLTWSPTALEKRTASFFLLTHPPPAGSLWSAVAAVTPRPHAASLFYSSAALAAPAAAPTLTVIRTWQVWRAALHCRTHREHIPHTVTVNRRRVPHGEFVKRFSGPPPEQWSGSALGMPTLGEARLHYDRSQSLHLVCSVSSGFKRQLYCFTHVFLFYLGEGGGGEARDSIERDYKQ